MLIDSIELYHVAMPLTTPFRTAFGDDFTIESVLCRMTSGGDEGWGEASPFSAPCYSSEWAGGAFATARDWLAPALVGQSIESGDELHARLAHFKGNQFAKAALDTAWWVLHAEQLKTPLYRLLGGTRNTVEVGADFGVLGSIDELIATMGAAYDAGYPRVKLKYRPGWDVAMLEAVRSVFPTQAIHVDCNSGYTKADFAMFRRLDDFNLTMIEQPLVHDDLIDHARLQTQIKTPICLDESINSMHRLEQALELGCCRWVNIKPGRVGGLTPALKIHNMCRDAGVSCWVGGMLESAVGGRICTALATLDNIKYPSDIFPTSRFYAQDLSEPQMDLVAQNSGPTRIAALDVPGIGTRPVAERLARQCLAHARIEPRR